MCLNIMVLLRFLLYPKINSWKAEFFWISAFLRSLNQRLIKKFLFLIDNQQKTWYTLTVINLQIQEKEAIFTMKTYICRIVFVSPCFCWTQSLHSFRCTSDLGCAFLVWIYGFYAPAGVLFVFRGKPSNMSRTENSTGRKEIFYEDFNCSIFEKRKRECLWRD